VDLRCQNPELAAANAWAGPDKEAKEAVAQLRQVYPGDARRRLDLWGLFHQGRSGLGIREPPEKPDTVEQSLPEPRSSNMSPSGPVHCPVQSSQATL
jgi:hypothetical protein